eukprot:3109996-Rhodomonas_salina.1
MMKATTSTSSSTSTHQQPQLQPPTRNPAVSENDVISAIRAPDKQQQQQLLTQILNRLRHEAYDPHTNTRQALFTQQDNNITATNFLGFEILAALLEWIKTTNTTITFNGYTIQPTQDLGT